MMTVARVFLLSVITLVLIIPDEAEGFWCGSCFTAWSSWCDCSKKCGGGTMTRSRSRGGGLCSWCSEPTSESQTCNDVCENGGTASGGTCTCLAGFTGECCESCVEGTDVFNECNDKCKCVNGKPKEPCTRIRKEFTILTAEEQTRYVRAAKKIATDPTIKPAFDDLMYIHRILFPSIIHTPDMFLPWHRYFVLQYENLLRQASECKVSAIYWDWSVAADNDPWRANPGDVWYGGERGLGGNGNCEGSGTAPCCVRDGVFSKGEFCLIPGSAPPTCLRRYFNSSLLHNSAEVQDLLKETDFSVFEETWRTWHNDVHCAIGGTMCTDDAASAPEFFFHHGFVDKIWSDWQDISEANKNAHFPSVDHLMPRQGLFPKQLIELKTQPGSFGPIPVEYEQFPAAVTTRKRRSPKGKLWVMGHAWEAKLVITRNPFHFSRNRYQKRQEAVRTDLAVRMKVD